MARGQDPEDVQHGLAALALALVEVLCELMERQAIRGMESGTRTDEQIDRLGGMAAHAPLHGGITGPLVHDKVGLAFRQTTSCGA